MRWVIWPLSVLLLLTESPAPAAVHVQPRATPLRDTHLRLTPGAARQATLSGVPRSAPASSRAFDAVLNCENDNVIAPASTLALLPGDMAGNIFEVDPALAPFTIDTVSLGLLPQARSALPVLIGLDIFVYEPSEDSFVYLAGFDITIEDIDPAGAIFDVDLSPFAVEGSDDLLTLFGDFTNSTVDDLVDPAGDGSPRCLNMAADNVCSVLLPVDEEGLVIYGIDDDACAGGILNFDLVHEVFLGPVVPTQTSSWSGLKARF